MNAVAYGMRPSLSRLYDREWDVVFDEQLPSRGLPRGPWTSKVLRGVAEPDVGDLEVAVSRSGLLVMSGDLFDALTGGASSTVTAVKVHLRNVSRSFVFPYVESYSSLFDAGASDWRPSSLFPGRVEKVDRLVLRNVPIPDLFRIREEPGRLFVSAGARGRAERQGLADGIQWTPVDGSGS
jgi:hypothetical protein